jgi:hypothetical protein
MSVSLSDTLTASRISIETSHLCPEDSGSSGDTREDRKAWNRALKKILKRM